MLEMLMQIPGKPWSSTGVLSWSIFMGSQGNTNHLPPTVIHANLTPQTSLEALWYVNIYPKKQTYNGILLGHKKECDNTICATWMDLDIIIILSEVQRKTNIIGYHLYVEFLM